LTSGRVGSMAGLEAAAAPVASLRSATGLPSIEAGIGWSGTRFDRQRRPWISPLVRVRVSGYGALRGRPEPVTGRSRLACDRFGRLQREARHHCCDLHRGVEVRWQQVNQAVTGSGDSTTTSHQLWRGGYASTAQKMPGGNGDVGTLDRYNRTYGR